MKLSQLTSRDLFWPMLSLGMLLALAYGANWFLGRPPYAQIVEDLPASASLLRHERIKHGFDVCHVFEFSCADTALRDKLVSKWQLRDLTSSDEGPFSFLVIDPPHWWTPDTPAATNKFGRHDDDSESYLSVWEQSETGRLYVEVGRW